MACWSLSLSISSFHKVPLLDFPEFSSMADDTDTRCAIGYLKAIKLESCKLDDQMEVYTPILVVHVKMTTDRIQSRSGRLLLRVPVQDLETQSQCEDWIERSLLSAATQLMILISETGNPKVLLGELIWNMKEKYGAGEMCSGLAQIDATAVGREEFHPRVVKMWVKEKAGQFKIAPGSSSACCAVCLNALDEKIAVVELPCRHVFHSGCIEDWLTRKSNCPLCRSRVQISHPFWMY